MDRDRFELVSAPAASTIVGRLLRRLERGEVIEPLDLPETVWLVLAIVVLEQPITRAEIAARRLADATARSSCCCATAWASSTNAIARPFFGRTCLLDNQS